MDRSALARVAAVPESLSRHPYVSLCVVTGLLLTASWLLKRARVRIPARQIDLYRYTLSPVGVVLEQTPYWARSAFSRTLWAPTIVWNLFNFYTMPAGTHDWWNAIDGTVFLGALPFYTTVRELHALGVRGVVNTCDEYAGPVRTYRAHGIEQLHIPVVDYTSPSVTQIEQAVRFIEEHAARGDKVYVHCKAGKGRSTTVVVCYLMKAHKLTAQQALRMIIDQRHQVSKYVWRRPSVVEFARRYGLPTEDPSALKAKT